MTIDRNAGKLGFSIRERVLPNGSMVVYVSKIMPGGLAEQTGVVEEGMPLRAINGAPVPDLGAKVGGLRLRFPVLSRTVSCHTRMSLFFIVGVGPRFAAWPELCHCRIVVHHIDVRSEH